MYVERMKPPITGIIALENQVEAGFFGYSRVHNSIERLFWAGNQGNHQNFEKNDTSYETQCCFN